MSDAEPEEGLSWAGDDETGRAVSQLKPEPVDGLVASNQAQPTKTKSRGQFWSVFYGVFGGILLLYSILWGIYIIPNSVPHTELLDAIMYELGEALAISAPLLWLGGVLIVLDGQKRSKQLLWLLLGTLVLVPWPILAGSLL